jgi:putative spermidine/putrescine transport system substrate-binding protein
MTDYTLRRLLALSAALMSAGLAGTALARDFTIASWGGGAQEAQRKVYFDALKAEAKVPVQADVYLGGWGKFQAMKDSKEITWDAVNVETAELERGCEEGMFLKLDYAKFGRKASDFLPDAVSKCGVGA